MNDIPTPITDEATFQGFPNGGPPFDYVNVKIAKRLERELAAVRSELAHVNETLQFIGAESNSLRAERDQLKQQLAAALKDNLQLRTMCALYVSKMGLYHDDSELQDATAHPFIDWKRDTISEIRRKLTERALANPEVRAALDSAKEIKPRASKQSLLRTGNTPFNSTP